MTTRIEDAKTEQRVCNQSVRYLMFLKYFEFFI